MIEWCEVLVAVKIIYFGHFDLFFSPKDPQPPSDSWDRTSYYDGNLQGQRPHL